MSEHNIIIGLPWFPSLAHAVAYYEPHGNDEDEVRRKVKDGEIHLGTPPVRAGEVRRRVKGFRWVVEVSDSGANQD